MHLHQHQPNNFGIIMNSYLTPQEIVKELDTYIIGQQEAKRAVAIALRNRWRRQQVPETMRDDIMPNNIILIGPTGVGKTEIARRLAKLSNAPFIKVEATKYTEIGYVGRDVESMVRDLAELSFNLVKSEFMETVKEKANLQAIERVLDILIPPLSNHASQRWSADDNTSPDEKPNNEYELNEKTRAKFREKILNGSLNSRQIEISVSSDGSPMMQVIGTGSIDDLNKQIQDIFENMGSSKKPKTRKVTVEEAIELMITEEANKLIDQEAIRKEAIQRAENHGIIFIDEIDKIAGNSRSGGNSGGPDVSRQGVQRDLLPIVEGSTVNTKHGMMKTDHILFIASGAFHISKPSDLIPELQGRFPIRVELKSLTEEDFVKILTIPQNALTRQYMELLKTEMIELTFTDEGVKELAKIAAEVNSEIENIGARRLHTILSSLLEDVMFRVPDDKSLTRLEVTKEMVQERLSGLVKNRDLSRYIL